MNKKWDTRYLELAKFVSVWSKDPRKKVGAVVTEGKFVRGIGFNGFPTGIEDNKARLADQTIKLQLTIHAEINALAAAQGRGDTIYVFPCLPCVPCLSQIVQNNISRIITVKKSLTRSTKWNPELVLSLAEEAHIDITYL